MDLNDWLEDFDNMELDPDSRKEQIKEAAEAYNENFGTNHNPDKAFKNYEFRRLSRKYGETDY